VTKSQILKQNMGLCVVTGGTKGIGKAIVVKYASHGFDIVTCSRNEEDLKNLKSEVENKYEITIHTFRVDMSTKEEVLAFADNINEIGSVDVLVNNAGVFIPGSIQDEKDGVLEKMVETNLYSAYYITRKLLYGMQKAKGGYIFNMCSVASIAAYPNGGSYSISKFALYGFSKSLREELKGDNIKVTSVLPGATLTASWEGVELPQDRFMKPEDIADMVWATYQLSDRSVVEDLLIRPQLGDL
jgi:hypothetical protein